MSMAEMLRRDEGLRLKVYWDTEGYPTIGIGHLIMKQPVRDMAQINKVLSKQVGREITGNPGSITMEEATTLFERDLADMQRDIKSHSKVGPVWQAVNRSRQMALENMAFQMGVGGVAKFNTMLTAMLAGDWEKAYKAGRDSLWYQQTKGRASRVTMIILTGNLESYGVEVKTPARSLSAMAATVAKSSENHTVLK
ncbi:lysozyme [Escherichia phage BYEP02]|nr:lysozyme [Escherichia phage BYEP02]